MFERVVASVALLAALSISSTTEAQTRSQAKSETRTETSARGAGQLKLVLDQATCGRFDFGTIACGPEYIATLSGDRKRWHVVGENKAGAKGIEAEYPTTNPDVIVVWGVNFTRKGNDLMFGNQRVGSATTVR